MKHNLPMLLILLFTSCGKPGPALATDSSDSKTNVVFVVDTSGSMSGDKINKTRDALTRSVALLPDDANIGLLEFSGSCTWIVPIGRLDRNFVNGRIENMSAGGGTVIGNALSAASEGLAQHKARMGPKAAGATFQIVLMSDGANGGGLDPIDVIAQVSRTGQRLDVIGVEFQDSGIQAALEASGFKNGYHEVAQVDRLFQTIKQILKLETINIGSGGPGDVSVLQNIPPDVIRALLQAILTAERKTR